MALIYESENFKVEAVDAPLVDRHDGGHITITPKKRVSERQQLSAPLAIELMRLTLVVGEAMTRALRQQGIDIGRINYQDNGNWSVFLPEGPHLHIHLYGRAKNAVQQKYGESLHFPHRAQNPAFYEHLQPLTPEDVTTVRLVIRDLLQEPRYQNNTWHLSTITSQADESRIF